MKNKCEICKKEIGIEICDSDDLLDNDSCGVYFEDGNCWFCSKCWNDINIGIKINYRMFL